MEKYTPWEFSYKQIDWRPALNAIRTIVQSLVDNLIGVKRSDFNWGYKSIESYCTKWGVSLPDLIQGQQSHCMSSHAVIAFEFAKDYNLYESINGYKLNEIISWKV